MKWAIGAIVLAGGTSVTLAFVLLDTAGALLFTFATAVVMALGAAPVLLGVWTRRAAERGRRAPPPNVVAMMPPPDPAEAPHRPRDRAGRGRVHRRPKPPPDSV
jgi:hypothetical protein